MDATDRSISPVIIMRVIGRAMMAISPKFSPAKKKVCHPKKYLDSLAPKIMVAIKSKTNPNSHRTNARLRPLKRVLKVLIYLASELENLSTRSARSVFKATYRSKAMATSRSAPATAWFQKEETREATRA